MCENACINLICLSQFNSFKSIFRPNLASLPLSHFSPFVIKKILNNYFAADKALNRPFTIFISISLLIQILYITKMNSSKLERKHQCKRTKSIKTLNLKLVNITYLFIGEVNASFGSPNPIVAISKIA